jgi:type I restriction enzyme S subunit
MEFRTYNFEKLIDKKAESKFKGIGLLTNQYLKEGNYPIVDQGKSLTNGYTNDNSKIISVEKPIIIFGDHTRIFKFIDFDFAPGADGTKVIVPNYKLINPKLFYLLLKNSKIPNDGYGRHYKHLKELEFEIPSDFKKQEELANILSNKLSSLELMRQAALKQKEAVEALQGALLREVFPFKEGDELPNGWKWEKLDNIAKVGKSRKKKTATNPKEPTSFVPMDSVDDVTGKITKTLFRPYDELGQSYTYFENGDIIFAKITPCMQNGKCAIVSEMKDGFGYGSSEYIVLTPAKPIYTKWVHYFMRTVEFRKNCEDHFTGSAGQQRVPNDYIQKYLIPLPNDETLIVNFTNQLDKKHQDYFKLLQHTETQLEAIEAMPAAILREVFEFNKN